MSLVTAPSRVEQGLTIARPYRSTCTGSTRAKSKSTERHRECLPEHEPHDDPRCRPKRRPDANLARPLHHAVAQHAEQPNTRDGRSG